MESVKQRIAFAVMGLVALVLATLYFIGVEIAKPNSIPLPYLAIMAVAWAYAVPNIIRLRTMIAERRQGRE